VIAHNPLYGSGQAVPHPALALGDDAHAPQRIGMTVNRPRYRYTRWSLPLLLTASASQRDFLTRLNTRPARSPVNASTPPLRAAPHDSRPMWVARSRAYHFCVRYTSPV
jgi:hypothetical protein